MPNEAAQFDAAVAADGFVHLAMTHQHVLRAGAYPRDHRDPLDRMLAAQAEMEQLVLVTRDPVFALFDARTVW